MPFPLTASDPSSLGLDPQPLERLGEIITRHLAEGRYPGAQIAVARRGKLGLVRTFGEARLDPERVAARDDTLWLLYSNTKVITTCAVWILAERGALRFTDRVAEHLPGFEGCRRFHRHPGNAVHRASPDKASRPAGQVAPSRPTPRMPHSTTRASW